MAAINQDHKKNNHAQEHKKYLGKPFSTREENPTNPLLYSQEKDLPGITKPSTQKGASVLIISELNF
jgi:hypothetical protein